MAMREFWLLTTFFLVALRRALTVAWIRINKFLTNPDWLIRPVTPFRHKVRCARLTVLSLLNLHRRGHNADVVLLSNKKLTPDNDERAKVTFSPSTMLSSLRALCCGCPDNILEQRRSCAVAETCTNVYECLEQRLIMLCYISF